MPTSCGVRHRNTFFLQFEMNTVFPYSQGNIFRLLQPKCETRYPILVSPVVDHLRSSRDLPVRSRPHYLAVLAEDIASIITPECEPSPRIPWCLLASWCGNGVYRWRMHVPMYCNRMYIRHGTRFSPVALSMCSPLLIQRASFVDDCTTLSITQVC